jgi:hypothetical protein
MSTMLETVRSKLRRGSVVKPLYVGRDHAVARIGPCLTILARAYPAEGIEHEAPRWVDALLAARPQKGGLIVVMQTSTAPPDTAGLTRVLRAHQEYVRGVAVGAMVIEGTSLQDFLFRTSLTPRTSWPKYPYPVETCTYVGEGAVFVAQRLPLAPPDLALAIAKGVEDLRAVYPRVPPDEPA